MAAVADPANTTRSVESTPARLGLGAGWRPELALAIERRTDLGFVEIFGEPFYGRRVLPGEFDRLRARGVQIVVHGLTLSLGSGELPDREKLDALAELARRVEAPFVSEHVAFTHAGAWNAGHLLPVSRTRDSLDVLVDNVRRAQEALPVPLVLENVAHPFSWPEDEIPEGEFLAELLERTDAGMLLDASNLYANVQNHGWDTEAFLSCIPRERIVYVHVAGGHWHGRTYEDTHVDALSPELVGFLRELFDGVRAPGIMLERDAAFPREEEWNAELDLLREVAL